MEAEAKLINAVCQNKDIGILMSEDIDTLFVTHNDVWEYIRNYWYKYKSVPDATVVEDEFRDFDVAIPGGSTQYYLDELRDSYIKTRLKNIMRDGAYKLGEHSGTEVLEGLNSELTSLGRMSSTVRDVDVTDFGLAEKHYEMQRERALQMGGTPGIPTGIAAIDASYTTGMAPGHLIVMLGWSGRGKCSTLTTPTLTPTGWVNNGDLKEGDEVIGSDGKGTKVTGIFPQGKQDIYEVRIDDGTIVEAGREHLWTVYTPKRRQNGLDPIVLTTQEIIDRGVWRDRPDLPGNNGEPRWFLPIIQPVQHPKVDLPVEAYTLGVLLANGSLKSNTIAFTTNDEQIADEVAARSVGLHETKTTPPTARRWGIYGMIGTIKEIGLHGLGSREKYIPEQYLLAHEEARRDILAGLLDCDGSVRPGQRAFYHSYSKRLAEDVRLLVLSLGGVAQVITKNRSDGDTEYQTALWTPFNPFRLDRKANDYSPRPWFRAIRSIEKRGEAEMQCISVEAEDCLYTVNDYVLTHNTWFSTYLACKAWEQGFKPMIISLEMAPENMRDRVYTLMGSGLFRASKFNSGDVDVDQFKHWANKKFTNKNQFVIVSSEGSTSVTPLTVQSKIDQHRPDMVILDYHQLFSDSSNARSEVERNRNISRDFKLLAVSNNIPVIDLSQATQDDVSDTDTPPLIEQVAWSKGIQHDADMAIAVHKHKDSDYFDIVCRKNRHGEEFAFGLDWDIDQGIVTEVYAD